MMKLSQLIVTHNELRNSHVITDMADFVREGGKYTRENLFHFSQSRGIGRVSPLIQISRFQDGDLYIHDGHHRVVSCFQAGRFFLMPDEYEITNWTYDQYTELCFDKQWYTPFDPRVEVRTPDFSTFKKEAVQRLNAGEDPKLVTSWVLANTQLYRTSRLIFTVGQLAKDSIPQLQKI